MKFVLSCIITFSIILSSFNVNVFACDSLQKANEGMEVKQVKDAAQNMYQNSEENDVLQYTLEMNQEDYYQFNDNKIKTYNLNAEILKQKIYRALCEYKYSVDVTEFCTTESETDFNQIMGYYFEVLNEKPELFYPSQSVSIGYNTDFDTGKVIYCNLGINYLYDKDTTAVMKNKVAEKTTYIKEKYLQGINDKLQLQYVIHDYLLENTTYDHDNYITSTVPPESHSIYGALIEGTAVCDGYAKSAKYLLDLVGIESGIITSGEMSHAWNYVNIDGKYYHMDITWDDPVPETNTMDYSYFNLSDNEIAKTHTWIKDNYPACISEDFDFFSQLPYNGTARIDKKLYYFDYRDDTIKSRNLDGSGEIIECNNAGGPYLTGYGRKLYYSRSTYPNCILYEYDIFTKVSKTLNVFAEYIDKLYVKNGTLYASNANENFSLKLMQPEKEDLNGDGIIDIADITMIAINYNSRFNDASWKKELDLNGDNIIDIFDLVCCSSRIK